MTRCLYSKFPTGASAQVVEVVRLALLDAVPLAPALATRGQRKAQFTSPLVSAPLYTICVLY